MNLNLDSALESTKIRIQHELIKRSYPGTFLNHLLNLTMQKNNQRLKL